MTNRMYARMHVYSVNVDRRDTRFLVEAGSNVWYKVDDDVRIPTWVQQAISRGESAFVLLDFDHLRVVRRIRKGSVDFFQ